MVRFRCFTKWLADGGVDMGKIKIRYYAPSYRGVHARGTIRRNEVFLVVPRKLLITLEMAKATPIGAQMVKAKVDLLSPKHSYLSSFVLQERRKPETFWAPYFEMLPKSVSNFPVFFTVEEKQLLAGSPFLRTSAADLQARSRTR
jgi:histone-lysine N-methyltransferase SETD3